MSQTAHPSITTLSKERLMNVLLAPHITEKTALAMQNSNQYAFRVRRDASKPDIKAAVELMFEVKVDCVNVVNEPGKARRFGKTPGRTQDWKKAYVRLAKGQSIDYEASRKA
ncbi:MAG: 50S ribosomal protein L23 [Gammaproteobacteria bacterium]|nr:50S ribosomal protein L23 [Gammaproteobacteria bacterium]